MVDQTPPLSNEELQTLLSQYLDGVLNTTERQRVQTLLETHPAYLKEYNRLRQLRNTIGQMQTGLEGGKSETDLWQNISRQLQEDRHAPVGRYDFEFVSAYYDNEVAPAEKAPFEQQLYTNDDASRMLGNIDELATALGRALHAAGVRAVGLTGADAGIGLSHVADEDWVRRSQAQFAPLAVGERLWIGPSWHEPPPDRTAVRLDPTFSRAHAGLSLALAERCDAFLRIGGASVGADQEMAEYRSPNPRFGPLGILESSRLSTELRTFREC